MLIDLGAIERNRTFVSSVSRMRSTIEQQWQDKSRPETTRMSGLLKRLPKSQDFHYSRSIAETDLNATQNSQGVIYAKFMP